MASGAQYLTGGGEGAVRQWFGVYYGYIAVNVDPTAQGRVRLRVPQVLGNATSGWAVPMVAVSFVPKVGTRVSVMFVGGDPTQPVWFGNFALPIPPPVTINAGPPSDSNPGSQIGEIWYDSGDGMKTYEWNGESWIAYQLGTGGLASGVGITEPVITGGTITGSQFIADGTSGQILGYSGTPAAGNMNVSVSPVAGTDGKGNGYLDGVTVYSGKSHLQLGVSASNDAPAVGMTTGAASEQGTAALYTFPPNVGGSNEFMITWLQGPSSTHDSASAAVVLQSSATDGSSAAYGGLVYNGGVIASWDVDGFNISGPLHGTGGTLTIADIIQADSDVHISGTLFGVGGTVAVGDAVAFQKPISAGTGWVNMTQGADLVNWSVGSGGIARYKKMPDNTVMVHMTNLLTNGFTGSGTPIWATPYPLTNGATQNFPIYWTVLGGSNTGAPSLQQQPFVYMSGGDLFIGYPPSNVSGVSLVIRYAID